LFRTFVHLLELVFALFELDDLLLTFLNDLLDLLRLFTLGRLLFL
jgi:hypothetical protein